MTTPRKPDTIDGPVAIPPILYKYASWRNEYHKRLITHREIFFASARRFNDPFDSAIALMYSRMTPDQKLTYSRRMGRWFAPPGASEEVISELTAEILRSLVQDGSKDSKLVAERQKELMYRDIGLFSVSEVRDSILMWSYYAESHSGFCVGYDARVLNEYLARLGDSSHLLFDQRPIEYAQEYPILNPGELNDKDFFLKRTHAKSHEWKHEREWRFVVIGTTDYPLQLPAGTIKELILGCRICDAHKEEIMASARETLGPSVTFRQTKTKAAEFGLELVPLA
jgi:hypothetical protein